VVRGQHPKKGRKGRETHTKKEGPKERTAHQESTTKERATHQRNSTEAKILDQGKTKRHESARAAHEGGRNLPPEASARASLQKQWEATGAELVFAARLTGQQAEDGRPRPGFSVHLRWQLPKPFPAVTFDDKPLLLHPSLQHLLPTLEASDAQATGCRLHAPQRTPGGRLGKGSQRCAFFVGLFEVEVQEDMASGDLWPTLSVWSDASESD